MAKKVVIVDLWEPVFPNHQIHNISLGSYALRTEYKEAKFLVSIKYELFCGEMEARIVLLVKGWNVDEVYEAEFCKFEEGIPLNCLPNSIAIDLKSIDESDNKGVMMERIEFLLASQLAMIASLTVKEDDEDDHNSVSVRIGAFETSPNTSEEFEKYFQRV